MRKSVKTYLSLGLAAIMTFQTVPAAAAEINVPSSADDVEFTGAEPADHIIINQVYTGGGKGDTPIANGFVELYNPTEETINLKGYTLSTETEATLTLSDIDLTSQTSYLVISNPETTSDTYLAYTLPAADQNWDCVITNKSFTITLKKDDNIIDTANASDVKISKQKSMRRVDYQDTDAASDWEVLAWGDKSDTAAPVVIDQAFIDAKAPRNSKNEYGALYVPASTPDAPSTDIYESVEVSDVKTTGFSNGNTTLDMQLYARYNSGAMSKDGGSMEIVEYNNQNKFAYAVSGLKGKIVAIPVSTPDESADKVVTLSGKEFDVKTLVESASAVDGFVYGDITSVAISSDGQKLAASVQHLDYDKAGVIAVFNCGSDGTLSNPILYPAGIQPDMVTFADDNTILTADEGEPRNGFGADCTDPIGTVTILNLAEQNSTQVDFTSFDTTEETEKILANNILLGKANGEILAPSKDFEPEYIAVSSDKKIAYVALQEANAIAVLDIAGKTFTDIYSVGFEDYSKVPVDIVEDQTYSASVYQDLLGARMPDGITVYEKDGKTYILTANEGDSREWGDETANTYYFNEAKTDIFTKDSGKSIKIIDADKCAGLPEEKTVMFGGRGFTILEVTENGLTEIFDSADDFERITALAFPDYFNCSNDNIKTDSRSGKKGPEPENVTIGTIGTQTYAFVAIERTGGIMAYDITDPQHSSNVNYINSRDFSDKIKGDVSPEGICFITADSKPVILAACEVSGTLAAYQLTQQSADDIIVLYTNDVHNAYEKSDKCLGYASVTQYKKQLEALGYQVTLVDNGDALQGGVIGTLSKGSYIKDIMEKTGYTIAVPGNHEFDFGMDNFLKLADEASYDYVSCNFIDKRTSTPVFDPYRIVDYNGKKVAYIGITTPETFTKSTPTYFQNENGEYIYSFCEGENGKALYTQIQTTVNAAKEAGADYIIAMGHIGTDPASEPWTSKEIIANTTGIDVFLDGHSHSTIASEICKDKNNEDVLLTSTGTKLTSLGELKIHADGTFSSSLITKIDKQDTETLTCVNNITDQFRELQESKVASSDIDLLVNDPKTGDRLIRSQETNLGDLCADAYRTLLGADVAFVNGGGIRANISAGDITYGDIINVHPFGNAACLIEATGQQILDALEFASRSAGIGECGGFLQVSGLTYDIDTRIESSAKTDDKDMFTSVDGAYRVKNVKIAGQPLDPAKTYTLASHNYMLKFSGDGFSMFAGNKILQDEVMIDNQVLINYITKTLNGKITADSIYADPYGEGRIRVITGSTDATCTAAGTITYLKGKETVTVEDTKAVGHTPQTQVSNATLQQDGSIVTKCSTCGTVTASETISHPTNIALAKTRFTYNGKTQKPSVAVTANDGKAVDPSNYTVTYTGGCKKVGSYTVTITFQGNYSGTVNKTFTIVPKGTSLTKVSAKSKGFAVKWKKQTSQTAGYEIQYSTSSKFTKKTTKTVKISKNKTTKKTIFKLKTKKKYYVRIRTYQNVKNGKKTQKYYSSWSKVKKVTTKR